MTYLDLNINQRINAKANEISVWGWHVAPVYRRRNDEAWGRTLNYLRMILKSEVRKEKEPHNAGNPDYNAPSQGEISEQMHKIQRDIK